MALVRPPLSFLAADQHGTGSIAVTADSTQALTRRYTTTFGTARGATTGVWPDDKAFLGMPTDTGTGLTHVGAREYDSSTGQFISVDPLLTLEQHQSLNGYSYSDNNPVTTSDPSGLSNQISCEGDSCDGEMRFKESHAAPDFSSGETWEEKYPWETSHYDYYDPNAVYCDAYCEMQLQAAMFTPAVNMGQCGSTIGGTSCPGFLTPGQIRAGAVISMLDPTGFIGGANCIQNPSKLGCGFALAGAVPIFGKGFKGGKVLLEGIDGLDNLPKKLPGELDFPAFPEGKAAAYSDGNYTLSGYGELVTDGFARADVGEVGTLFDMQKRQPFFKDNAAGDGAYYLSHAEKQAATLSPGSPVVVTKPMCDNCFQGFTDLARDTGQSQWVVDPSGLYVFKPKR